VSKDLSPKVKLQQMFMPKKNVVPKAFPNLPTKIIEVRPHFPKWE
jgi:hypothetical protein